MQVWFKKIAALLLRVWHWFARYKPRKNQSELLFEQYLKAHKIQKWDYEPKIEGKSQRPDYRLRLRGKDLFFEVKEFRQDPTKPLPRGGAYDPYPRIREKINAGREKFKHFKEYCCSLVLHNVDALFVHLNDPTIVMGAMLGDFGFQFPFDPELGQLVGEPTYAFLKRGKMIDYKHMQPQNTTISALVVLEHLPLGQRRLRIKHRRKEKELGRSLNWDEFMRLAESLRMNGLDTGEMVLRVVVYENPYARIGLARDIFVGPFDERFGLEGDHMARIFAGKEILRLEAQEESNK